jgi:hypothetical protein
MSDESTIDEQSHYEISLTAGQAFVAFVLLLLSLAATFAFGLMIGRGQGDDRLVVRKEPSVVTEAAAIPKKSGKIVELGVAEADFKTGTAATDTSSTDASVLTETSSAALDAAATPAAPANSAAAPEAPSGAAKPVISANPVSASARPTLLQQKPLASDVHSGTTARSANALSNAPAYAQLLSTADQKTAEALAAQVINGGYTSAYVDRTANEKGQVFRVRVRFPSEADARAAEPRLKTFAKDVWIVK